MSSRRLLVLSFILSAVIFCWFTWPLPRHVASGIPSSSQNIEKDSVRRMIVGDHLQLLYSFWLVSEMAAGEIPLLHNVYEFNQGDDSERHEPRHYYVPFSLVFSLLAWIVGKALAYNLTAFLSIWLSLFFTWLLVRRYVEDDPWCVLLATLSILLPYRWVNLLGGSPAGFAMMWVPAMLLGLDVAVRDERMWGGVLAGAALVFARLCDVHVFFFSGLLAPFWCLTAFVCRKRPLLRNLTTVLRIGWVLLPGVLLSLFAVVYSLWRGREFGLTDVGAGRDILEVAGAAPIARDFFRWRGEGVSSHVYVGFTLPLIVASGVLVLTWNCIKGRCKAWRVLPAAWLICAALVGIACLALGPNGPFSGVLFLACRKLIQPYAMVRQTAKIFCVIPPLLAVIAALSLRALHGRRSGHWRRRLTGAGVCLLLLFEYGMQVRPTVCLLDSEQAAYAAVTEDARQRQAIGRVLVLPIWPGNSSWTAAAQHYVSLYRLRMLNGYSPVVRNDYYENVYRRFKSANKGELTDGQLDALLRMGIGYVVLHEDAVPEKVTPFSVWFTLRSLLHHPRLALLKQGEAVWAFRILPEPVRKPRAVGNWSTYSSARMWRAWRCPLAAVRVVEEDDRKHAVMDADDSFIETESAAMVGAPGLRYLVRARGVGRLLARILADGKVINEANLDITGQEWDWHEVPVGRLAHEARVAIRLEKLEGKIELDVFVLCAGVWAPPGGPGQLDVPATAFFHAGYSDATDGSVVLRADTEPDKVVFYGPKLPLPAGEYEVRVVFDSAAAQGTELGHCFVRTGRRTLDPVAMRAGKPMACYLPQAEALPVRLGFKFARNADVRIRHVSFVRR